MTLTLVLDGRAHEISVDEQEEGVFQVQVDGEPFEVSVEREDGFVTSTAAGRGFLIRREGRSLVVDGERGDVGVRHLAQARMGADGAKGGEVMPPMPGRIVEVLVEEGDAVEAGQGLVVLEAMKMQNEIDAPGASVVKEVLVEEGDAVEASDVLVVLEPKG